METMLILHNIRSNENVGSMFRTADAAGVKKIYLSGYTPAPLDKFGRKNNALAKAALGAQEFVAWEKVPTLSKVIKKIPDYKIIAVEQDEKSKDYKKFIYPKKTALVMGNEVAGLTKKELSLCDAIVEIPMKGKKESLNVSVAAGIALFSIQ